MILGYLQIVDRENCILISLPILFPHLRGHFIRDDLRANLRVGVYTCIKLLGEISDKYIVWLVSKGTHILHHLTNLHVQLLVYAEKNLHVYGLYSNCNYHMLPET